MRRFCAIVFFLASALVLHSQGIPTGEVGVGDPFIYADSRSGWYYLYRSATDGGPRGGVEVLKSCDLQTWDGPF